METMTAQIGGTVIRLTQMQGLSISLPRSHWSARLVGVAGRGAGKRRGMPHEVSGVGMADRDAPRWKGLVIDGQQLPAVSSCSSRLGIPCVSYMRHLTGLTIDVECADRIYKNQVRGAPAYAPQVLFRILVLMFVSGTPFESTTLQRLQTDVASALVCGLEYRGTRFRMRARCAE